MRTCTAIFLSNRRDPQLLIAQVAARVGSPQVSGRCLRSDSRIAAAELKIRAPRAAALKRMTTIFQSLHNRIGGIFPDRPKTPLPDITERVMPPKRVGMNVSEAVDAGQRNTGAVPPSALQ